MKKRVVHIERITKPGEKFPFQIKIPLGAIALRKVWTSIPIYSHPQGDDITGRIQVGDLILSIPSARNHFYSDSPQIADDQTDRLLEIKPPGMSFDQSQWIQAQKPSFFDIECDGSNTFIEGFYQDTSSLNYSLKIYLEFDV